MGNTIPPNNPCLNSMDRSIRSNTEARRERAVLEGRNQSGGASDLLHEGDTPDIMGMLRAERELSSLKVSEKIVRDITLQSDAQISTINIFNKMATSFLTRLSQSRTSTGIPDLELPKWCEAQLNNIANFLNELNPNGSGVFAENSVFMLPVDKSVMTSPLPAGSLATYDYVQGQFSGKTFVQISETISAANKGTAGHTGFEGLVRALRMGMNIDPTKYADDPTSSASLDCLTKVALPGLASCLRSAGELGQAADQANTHVTAKKLRTEIARIEASHQPAYKIAQDMMDKYALVELQKNTMKAMSHAATRFSETILGG